MVLSVCEFCENLCRESHIFLMRKNAIQFAHVLCKHYDISKLKNTLILSVKFYGFHHLQSGIFLASLLFTVFIFICFMLLGFFTIIKILTNITKIQTKHFNVTQHCATCFNSLEASSGAFRKRSLKHKFISNMQMLC
jgi:hypothetical protein